MLIAACYAVGVTIYHAVGRENQLMREKHADEAVLIGFTTHHGTVTAASDWGKSAERKRVRPALAGSYEALFHAAGRDRFLLVLNESDMIAQQLRNPRLERAIGVIYRPETERQSHYFRARLPDQFDAVLHFDATRGQTARIHGRVGNGRASGNVPIRGVSKAAPKIASEKGSMQ
jgi:erythromycin esterase-like protein